MKRNNIKKMLSALLAALLLVSLAPSALAAGKGGKTPVGTYKVVDKIEHPTWHVAGRAPIPYGDPDNLLGTHWLALDLEGYGLHGTWDPASLGSQASDGCVRLHNDDIKELYTILPKGTVVTIAD